MKRRKERDFDPTAKPKRRHGLAPVEDLTDPTLIYLTPQGYYWPSRCPRTNTCQCPICRDR